MARLLDYFKKYPFWPYIKKHRKNYLIGLMALVVVDAINVMLPLSVRDAIDSIPIKNYRGLIFSASAYFCLTIVQSVGRYLWRLHLNGTSHLIARSISLDLYDHLQRLPLAYYQKIRTGDLMSRATNDIEAIRTAVGPGFLVTVDAVLVFLMIIPVMFFLSIKLSLLALAFYPLVPFITFKLGNKIDALFERMQVRMSYLGAYAQETFSSIRLIKSLVLESRAETAFKKLSEDYRVEGVELSKYQAVFSPTLSLMTQLGTFLILIVGGFDVLEGSITIGTYIAFQRFVVQLSWPMEAIGWAVTMNKEGYAAHRRVFEIFKIPQVNYEKSAATIVKSSSTVLKVTNLDYQYGDGKFRLYIPELKILDGQKIGLVGPVGSGKTTLFSLILRLYDPPRGTIQFLGQDVLDLSLHELRRQISSVEQSVFLFSENITTNVLMGLGSASDEEFLRSIRTSHIYDEVVKLPYGFDTVLGERGVNLSGGQKQRLALARSLVRSPRLLLLDDAFSAVDVHVESKIIKDFFNNYPDVSLCFASHRLSIMPQMDEVWVINSKELDPTIEKGTHKELLKTSRMYRSLWEKSENEIEIAQWESECLDSP